MSLQSFRRTAAQDAVARGLPLRVVQALTGHKSLGSLGEYLQASRDEVLAVIGDQGSARLQPLERLGRRVFVLPNV